MGSASRRGQASRDGAAVYRVLTAVAEYEECDPRELPPLADAVDPDILDRVVQGSGVTELTFSYHGYHITIDGDGHVHVTPEQKESDTA